MNNLVPSLESSPIAAAELNAVFSAVLNAPTALEELEQWLATPIPAPKPPSLAPVAAHIEQHDLLIRVQEYLRYYGNPAALRDVSMLDGFFAALDCAPLPVPPAAWVCEIWGGKAHLPQWPSEYAGMIFAELILHFQYNVVQHLRSVAVFKPLFISHQVGTASFDVIDYWCEGFMRGARLGNRPLLAIPDIQALLEPIERFAQGDGLLLALAMAETEYADIQTTIGRNVRAIWECSRNLPDYGVDHSPPMLATPPTPVSPSSPPETHPTPAKPSKPGRNDPCPCGSGRKYKKCCM